jgi:4-carboxymuconolactone decarboxylase
MSDESFERGLQIRREMFGPDRADKEIEAATDFTRPFHEMATSYCFGDVWSRPGLDRKTRSLLTVAMLTALGRSHEIKAHVHGAISNGASKEELRELFVQAIPYCGLPLAGEGLRSAREVLVQFGLEE